MTESEKVEAARADLEARGVRPRAIAPPFYRLAWRLGWRLAPPHFQSFGRVLLTHLVAMVGWTLPIMWLWLTVTDPGVERRAFVLMLFGVVPAVALVIGLAVGLAAAAYYRKEARRLRLPSWRSYRPEARARATEGP
jgi:Family of unknown function (DUF6404)